MFIWKFITQFCKYHVLLSFHKLLGNSLYKLYKLCVLNMSAYFCVCCMYGWTEAKTKASPTMDMYKNQKSGS